MLGGALQVEEGNSNTCERQTLENWVQGIQGPQGTQGSTSQIMYGTIQKPQ